MNKYAEWADRKILIDLRNRFATCYQNDDGSIFYIEPQFYTCLMGYKRLRPEQFDTLLKRMDEIVRKNKKVVFVGQEECPLVEADDAIFLTALDVADSVGVLVEDKSNPESEYQD